ncbi:hypothetical protein ACLOJK_016468 [Asimina triloba]
MSAFGGDSWAREAQNRKRRVDELLLLSHDASPGAASSSSSSPNSYKKLRNGKYACLVCPNNPILDSPLMLSMHVKGSRHVAAESKLKERELWKHEEIKKRIALSSDSADIVTSTSPTQHLKSSSKSKPLIEHTRIAVFEALHDQKTQVNAAKGGDGVKSSGNASYFGSNSQTDLKQEMKQTPDLRSGLCHSSEKSSKVEMKIGGGMIAEQHARRERELKFTSAGWKRDCRGKWFRDENVEFDSDEDDPNICLS